MATQVIFAEPPASRHECLESLLQRRLAGRVRDLRVDVRPNGLVLHGRAATYHAKQIAQQVVMEMVPVPLLANDIEVS